MRRSPKLNPSRWDALVVCVVILLAVLSAVTIWGKEQEIEELTVVISVDGEEVERCLLTELPDMEVPYSANGYTLYVELAYTGGPNYASAYTIWPGSPTIHLESIPISSQRGNEALYSIAIFKSELISSFTISGLINVSRGNSLL